MSSFTIYRTFLVLLQIFKRTRNMAFSEPHNTFLRCVSAKPYQNVWARTLGYFYGGLWLGRECYSETVVMNSWSQIVGGLNRLLPKEIIANRFFWDSRWLESWSNHFCPSMGPNGGSVAMDSVLVHVTLALLGNARLIRYCGRLHQTEPDARMPTDWLMQLTNKKNVDAT